MYLRWTTVFELIYHPYHSSKDTTDQDGGHRKSSSGKWRFWALEESKKRDAIDHGTDTSRSREGARHDVSICSFNITTAYKR